MLYPGGPSLPPPVQVTAKVPPALAVATLRLWRSIAECFSDGAVTVARTATAAVRKLHSGWHWQHRLFSPSLARARGHGAPMPKAELWLGPRIVRQWTPSDVRMWLGVRGVPSGIAEELFTLGVGGLTLMSLHWHYAAGRGALGLSTWRKVGVTMNLDPDARAIVAGACEQLPVERWGWVLSIAT